MRKIIYLLLAGFIPLLMGGIVNVLVTSSPFPVFIISPICLLIWYFIGYKFAKDIRSFVILNIPAIFFFVLILVQELVMGHYIEGAIGMTSQMFFLPFLSAGALVAGWTGSMAGAYVGSFLLMLASCYIGTWQRMKKGR